MKTGLWKLCVLFAVPLAACSQGSSSSSSSSSGSTGGASSSGSASSSGGSSSGASSSSSAASSSGGGACGSVTDYGECNGTVNRYCDEMGVLQVYDCADDSQTCGLWDLDWGYGCQDPACSSIPAGGRCTSATHSEACTDTGVATYNCADDGLACVTMTGGVTCDTAASSSSGGGSSSGGAGCGTVTDYGECEGTISRYCDEMGVLQVYDCATDSQTCGLWDLDWGYGCQDPACSSIPAGGRCTSATQSEACTDTGAATYNCADDGLMCVTQAGGVTCGGGSSSSGGGSSSSGGGSSSSGGASSSSGGSSSG